MGGGGAWGMSAKQTRAAASPNPLASARSKPNREAMPYPTPMRPPRPARTRVATLALTGLAALVALAAVQACRDGGGGPASDAAAAYVEADLYYRYGDQPNTVTAEAKLRVVDSLRGRDTAYVPPGGVAFLGSDLAAATSNARGARYRGTRRLPGGLGAPRFTFVGEGGGPVEVAGALRPFDTLIMGPMPTHNFGFTVYGGAGAEPLREGEALSALFQPDDPAEAPRLASVLGPSPAPEAPGAPVAFAFPRQTVADWPLGQGAITFVRRRITPLEQAGLRGRLVEEVYYPPIRSAVVN